MLVVTRPLFFGLSMMSGVPDTAFLDAVGRLDPEAAYFAVNRDQEIIYWSPGAERLLGFQAEEVLGKHCSRAIKCVRCSVGCGIKQYGTIQGKTMAHWQKNGQEASFDKYAQAIYDDEGRFIGGVEVLRPKQVVEREARFGRGPVEGREAGGSELVDFHGILTRNAAFLDFLTGLRHVAFTGVNVLIRGESGTGKELVAKALHAMSGRAGKPFTAINCGTLSKEFLASELFGHKRGAFTGALSDKKGMLSVAEGGTLFLDEVAELPLDVQASLLRVLQERRYRPMGDTREYPVDVRIISATHTSLRERVAEKRFREDLMYRLRVVPLFVPPLRERSDDIIPLWERMLAMAAENHQLPAPQSTPELKAVLLRYAWPGNVRELINIAEFVTVTRPGREVLPDHLPPEFKEVPVQSAGPGGEVVVRRGKAKPDRMLLEQALRETDGNTVEAAKMLGISRATLWRWRKKFGILD